MIGVGSYIISIKADKLILTDGSQITSSTFGAGKGGTLIIEVMDTVSLAGHVVVDDDIYPSGITTSSLAEGDAGTIRLTAKYLKINQGANIESATYWGVDLDGITYNSTGKSGIIIIDTTASIEIAGKVENSVATKQRIVSSITSASQGTDNGGQVIINTPLLILTDSAQITTSVERDHSEAGSIELRIAQLQANDQAAITSESFGEGDAGNININASDCITVNHAKISTEAKEAAGGNIIITVPQLLNLKNSTITTNVKGGEGGGGDISITAPLFVVLNRAVITANAIGGNGGNITIKSNQFVASKQPEDSKVEASSQKALSGAIIITAPTLDLNGKVVILSNQFNTTKPLAPACQAKQADQASHFKVISFRGVGNLPRYFSLTKTGQQSDEDKQHP
jgi:large exoprotein involved in heme utilization and adhesion